MAESPYVFDVTQDEFAQAVLEKSHEVPVLVDFWAAWCGPCQMLAPMLDQLADEYAGKVLVAKVNSDEQQALAGQYGVRSLPTVKLFKEGKIVDEFMGVQPEPAIRELIEQHLPRVSDDLRKAAREQSAQGNLDEALALLRKAAEMEPDHHQVQIELARLLAQKGEVTEAEQILSVLPLNVQQDPQVHDLMGRLRFARAAEGAPGDTELEKRIADDPTDLQARYQLAARRILAGDYEPAMEQLLEIMRRDRGFENDAGREGLLAVFDMLEGGELATQYRRQMANLMH